MMLSILNIKNSNEILNPEVVKAARELNANLIVESSKNTNLGLRKHNLLRKATSQWVLFLDSDEVPSIKLIQEIKALIDKKKSEYNGYSIPYKNFIFGYPINSGGESYSKVRLFQKKFGDIELNPIHEEIIVKGKIGRLNGNILHYSYRTPLQVLRKFTWYAWLVSGEKIKAKEQITLKKLFLYGPHRFWARAIKDEGWRDGWRGIVLALFFAYMEGLTYWLLLARKIVRR